MPRDILSEYGNDSGVGDKPRATSGGIKSARDVRNYQPPQGPIGISRVGVGLGGHNCGPCGTQGPYESTGDGASGSPGLGGKNRGMGSNRRG